MLSFRATIILLVSLSLYACGGGGGGTPSGTNNPPSQFPSKMLSWVDPSTFTDGSPLDPARDLKELEIYVNQSGIFNDGSVPDAFLVAVDQSGQVNNSYDLANLAPYINFQKGVTYFVTVRSIGMTGVKSGFATPVSFSF